MSEPVPPQGAVLIEMGQQGGPLEQALAAVLVAVAVQRDKFREWSETLALRDESKATAYSVAAERIDAALGSVAESGVPTQDREALAEALRALAVDEPDAAIRFDLGAAAALLAEGERADQAETIADIQRSTASTLRAERDRLRRALDVERAEGLSVTEALQHAADCEAELRDAEAERDRLQQENEALTDARDGAMKALAKEQARHDDADDRADRLRELLRDIKQNIDSNGPDRPDLYKRLSAALGSATPTEEKP